MNGSKLVALDGTTLVHGLTNDVHDTAEGTGTDGDLNGKTSVDDLLTTNETLGTLHGNSSDSVLTQVLGDLENETTTTGDIPNLESVEDGG